LEEIAKMHKEIKPVIRNCYNSAVDKTFVLKRKIILINWHEFFGFKE